MENQDNRTNVQKNTMSLNQLREFIARSHETQLRRWTTRELLRRAATELMVQRNSDWN